MPSANPFAPVIDVGGDASVGPVSARASAAFGGSVSDHHATAAYLLIALIGLYALWKGKFRFSTTVG